MSGKNSGITGTTSVYAQHIQPARRFRHRSAAGAPCRPGRWKTSSFRGVALTRARRDRGRRRAPTRAGARLDDGANPPCGATDAVLGGPAGGQVPAPCPGGRVACSRSAIYVFTIPILAFTLSDPGVHVAPICALTFERSRRSRSAGTRRYGHVRALGRGESVAPETFPDLTVAIADLLG
jgi:hypothetical protein